MGRQASPARRSPAEQRQTDASGGATPEPKDKSRDRVGGAPEAPTPSGENEEQRPKESLHEKRDNKTLKCEQRPSAENTPSPKPARTRTDGRSTEAQWEPDLKRSRVEAEPAKSGQVKIKEEKKEHQDSPEVKPPPKAPERPAQERRTPGIPPSPLSSIPLPMGMPPGFPPGLDRTRLMPPFMGMTPLPGVERFPYAAQHWDPIRNMCRGLDVSPKDPVAKELLMRSDPLQRVYPREPLLHPLAMEQQQRCQLEERQRLALLREESERSRLLAMHHHAALESQLAHPGLLHPGPYASQLFPRLPLHHAGPYAALNKAMVPAGWHAPPPPLLHAMAARPGSPRRTLPLMDRNLEAP